MNQHRVLALKYRPKNFDELVGQESASRTLSIALDSGKLSHGYLFSGLRGSGKTSTARIFAKALLCEKGVSSTPCEVCPSCIEANENRHMDIIELDAASNRRIDDIRELIEQTKYAPASSRFKIFIIDEVHMLTKEAFNALLKTLEEPPSYVKFLLATTDPLRIPPTILSRVQHFRFRKIAHNDVVNHLNMILEKEGIEFDPLAVDVVSRAGGGSLRDTLTLLEQAIIFGSGKLVLEETTNMLGVLEPKEITRFFELVLTNDTKALVQFLESIENYDSETVLDGFVEYLKEMLYAQDSRFTPLLIERFFRVLSDSKSMLFSGFDSGFVLSLTVFKLVESLKVEFIEEEIKKLEAEVAATPKSTVMMRTTAEPQPAKKQDSKFDELISRIYDRSRSLGDVFTKNVELVEFKDGTLSWISCAEGDDKEQLRVDYPVIRTIVQEVFGVNTKIALIPCNKVAEPVEESKPTPKEQPLETKPSDLAPQKANPNDLLEQSFIRKAIDIFEPTKISISSDG